MLNSDASITRRCIALTLGMCVVLSSTAGAAEIPAAIRTIMQKPRYAGALWALHAVDVSSGEVIYALNSDANYRLLTGSVRKLYSVGVTLNTLGADYRFKTPVYRNGVVDATGNLKGDLILVASGDLTMGGRDNGDDTLAVTTFDHNDANNLGGGILTAPDPLAGLNKLAAQVAASGIKKIAGDVIIDDRLFKNFRVPNQNLIVSPIVINDNRIDVTVIPTKAGQRASVLTRPETAAFEVTANVKTVAAGQPTEVTLDRNGPHRGTVSGQIAEDYVPPLSGVKTMVQTFRIDEPDHGTFLEPSDFARTTFIEALRRAGIKVPGSTKGANHAERLPAVHTYQAQNKVAELISAPYSEYSKLILKVSHNLGANLSLMLFGLANGVNTIDDALSVEKTRLVDQYGLFFNGFLFPTNGSGSPDSRASAATTVQLLTSMSRRPTFNSYFASLPIMGVDGSLAEIGVGSSAQGNVFAKTGTFLADGKIEAQVLAGYIQTKSGRLLAYALYVNDAGELTDIADVIRVIEDEGAISTIIQQSN